MKKIKDLDELVQEDLTINNIIKEIKKLYSLNFSNPGIGEDTFDVGKNLIAHYFRIGNQKSIKRAEKEAKELAFKETHAKLTVFNKQGDVGITEAKALATEQLEDLSNEQVEAKYIAEQYEFMTDATKLAIMFSMAVMRELKNEKIMTNQK